MTGHRAWKGIGILWALLFRKLFWVCFVFVWGLHEMGSIDEKQLSVLKDL